MTTKLHAGQCDKCGIRAMGDFMVGPCCMRCPICGVGVLTFIERDEAKIASVRGFSTRVLELMFQDDSYRFVVASGVLGSTGAELLSRCIMEGNMLGMTPEAVAADLLSDFRKVANMHDEFYREHLESMDLPIN